MDKQQKDEDDGQQPVKGTALGKFVSLFANQTGKQADPKGPVALSLFAFAMSFHFTFHLTQWYNMPNKLITCVCF